MTDLTREQEVEKFESGLCWRQFLLCFGYETLCFQVILSAAFLVTAS